MCRAADDRDGDGHVDVDVVERGERLVELAVVQLDAHDDAGVDLARRGDRAHASLARLPDSAEGPRSTGLSTDAAAGTSSPSRPCSSSLNTGTLGTGVVGGVGSEDQRAAGVAHEGDAPSAWRRLTVEQQADVDQLLHRPRPDHAGVGEQRLDDAGVAGRCRRVRSGAARSPTPTCRP